MLQIPPRNLDEARKVMEAHKGTKFEQRWTDVYNEMLRESLPSQAKMNRSNPLDIVRHFAGEIQNGRTLLDITRHTDSELTELCDEIHLHLAGKEGGKDGIVGEAIDVIACMLDLIFVHAPNTSDAEINSILLAKCEKWARRYKDSVDGDRSID